MLTSRLLKPVSCLIVAGILGLILNAAMVIQRNTNAAAEYFADLILVGQVDEALLKSVTSVIDFMNRPQTERLEYSSDVQTDLSIFRNRWDDFCAAFKTGHPGISDLFEKPVFLDDEANAFSTLGASIVATSNPESQAAAYQVFLRLARTNLQTSLNIAGLVAQDNFDNAQKRMTLHLQIALAAILTLILAGVLLTTRTIKSSIAAKKAAESAAQAKTDFLSTMSHEIRTPMSGVLGMAELLERTELTEKQKLYVSTIIGSGEALTAIINDVLDLAKINAGKMTVRAHPFNIATMVEDIATLLATRAAERHNELAIRIQPFLPTHLIGDAGHIRQVITNLAGNAIKFTENGTVLIDISGNVDDQTVHMTVKVHDTGIGIPADKCPHIFDQFAQVEEKNATTRKGTGLGLAISSKLVALMGGDIGVVSEEGKGSCFSFTVSLPIDTEAVENAFAPENIAGARVLVVDDNATNRMVIVEQLKSWNLDAEAVESAEKAIACLRHAAERKMPFHLAILDYHMPQRDGLELARDIRRTPGLPYLPILMMTSIMTMADDKQFHELRIEGHLTKPARSALLLDTVVGILERDDSFPGPVAKVIGGYGI